MSDTLDFWLIVWPSGSLLSFTQESSAIREQKTAKRLYGYDLTITKVTLPWTPK